jgi:hypothetical protein
MNFSFCIRADVESLSMKYVLTLRSGVGQVQLLQMGLDLLIMQMGPDLHIMQMGPLVGSLHWLQIPLITQVLLPIANLYVLSI